MNKSILVSALLAVALSGCAPDPKVEARNVQARIEFEAQYRVTLLDQNGGVLRTWTSKEYVDTSDGVAKFIDVTTGKKVKVCGNFIVEQL